MNKLKKVKKIDFSKINISRWFVFLIDLIIVIQTFILSYIIRFNFSLHFDLHQFIKQFPIVILATSISFLISGSYKGIVRHTTLKDAWNVLKTSVFLSLILTVLVLITRYFFQSLDVTIPLSIIIIHFLLNTIVLISSRFIFKYLFHIVFDGINNKKAVLIYGTNKTSISTQQTLTDNVLSPYKVIGFVSDDKTMKNKTIHGLPILNLDGINNDFITTNKITELFIPTQNIASKKLIQVTDALLEKPINIKKIPPIEQWVNGDLQLSQIKKIKIEDLLNRAEIQLVNPKYNAFFNHKTILITGGAGSIGKELVHQISNYNYQKIIVIDKSESGIYELEQECTNNKKLNITFEIADIRNLSRMQALFEQYKPSLIFHAAAYKHVPLMERFPYEAMTTNILGTKIIADLAIKHNVARFVMVSTDKAVRPTNVMGATKRFAEKYLLDISKTSDTMFITTRFGNVLASNGSVIPLFQKQIANGGPLTVTDKAIERYFMTIPEACQLVIEAALMGENGRIFVFDMGESIKIYDVAKKIIQLSGLRYPEDIDIKIIGLRPGEKLYEELYDDAKNLIPTHHKKIMIVQNTSQVSSSSINKVLTALALEKDNTEPEKIKQLIQEIVSDYKIG